MAANSTSCYRPVQRHLHWAVFAFVLLAYVLIYVHVFTARDNPVHASSTQLHMLAGIVVLLLTVARLGARRKYGRPSIQTPAARLTESVASVTHWALYVLLLVQPLLGFTIVLVKGAAVRPFGLTLIPVLTAHPDKALASTLHSVHTVTGYVFMALIVLHILAALWHHYRLRDDTLQRMLPPQRS